MARRCKDCIKIERTWNWYDKYCLKCSEGCLKFPFAAGCSSYSPRLYIRLWEWAKGWLK